MDKKTDTGVDLAGAVLRSTNMQKASGGVETQLLFLFDQVIEPEPLSPPIYYNFDPSTLPHIGIV